MRRIRRLIALLIIAASGGSVAYAQTPTPWLPAATPASERPQVFYARLLQSSTTLGGSAGAYVAPLLTKRVQVVVGACTSYTLLIESSANGSSWVTEQTLSESTVGANATGYATAITAPVRYLRTRITAISSCTISTDILGVS